MRTPDRERQRRHRARQQAEIALQPIEATAAREALEAMLRLREQLRTWVGSAKFKQLPLEQQVPIQSLLGQVEGSFTMFAVHYSQLADRMAKVMRAHQEVV